MIKNIIKALATAAGYATLTEVARQQSLHACPNQGLKESPRIAATLNEVQQQMGLQDWQISYSLNDTQPFPVTKSALLNKRAHISLPRDFTNPDVSRGTTADAWLRTMIGREMAKVQMHVERSRDLFLGYVAGAAVLSFWPKDKKLLFTHSLVAATAFVWWRQKMLAVDSVAAAHVPVAKQTLLKIYARDSLAAQPFPRFLAKQKIQQLGGLSAPVPNDELVPRIHQLQAFIADWLAKTPEHELVDQGSPIANPVLRAIETGQLVLPAKHQATLDAAAQTVSVHFNDNDRQILQTFYEKQRQENSPLGEYYRTLSFDEFTLRLLKARYPAVYLDGRLLVSKSQTDALARVLFKHVGDAVSSDEYVNRKILGKIGRHDFKDRAQIYLDHLSLAEIMMSSLLQTHGVGIALTSGRREVPMTSDAEGFTCDIESAEPAIVVSDPCGIECRNGVTMSYDLPHVAVPKNPTAMWYQTIEQMLKTPMAECGKMMFGDQLAYAAKNPEQDPNFVLVRSSAGDEWYLSKDAYKTRLKKTYELLFAATDKKIGQYPGLGNNFNLKGMGLGVFGFSDDSGVLEKLMVEAIQETLAKHPPKHIKQVNLLNFPSSLETQEDIIAMYEQPSVKLVQSINGVRLCRGVGAPMANCLAGAGHLGATHTAGDAASDMGNELNASLYHMHHQERVVSANPGSSDDATGSNGLLNWRSFSVWSAAADILPQGLKLEVVSSGSSKLN